MPRALLGGSRQPASASASSERCPPRVGGPSKSRSSGSSDLPMTPAESEGLRRVLMAAYEDGERTGFLGGRRHWPGGITRQMRAEWLRGYADGARSFQEVAIHGEAVSERCDRRESTSPHGPLVA